jgi:hypothetical protein
MDYVYEACNPTILNLSIIKKKISLGLLDYRPKLLISIILGAVICMYIFLLLVRVFWLLCNLRYIIYGCVYYLYYYIILYLEGFITNNTILFMYN